MLWNGQALCQSAITASDTELSKEMENPVTRRITLPVRYEADFLDGPYKVTKDTFEIDQAVLPFRVNDDWALITRTKLPVVVQPPKDRGQSWASGLSNGYTTFFLSPERGEGMYWGVGPVLYYPSSTNPTVGVKKWGSGPSVAFFITEGSKPLGIRRRRQQHLPVLLAAEAVAPTSCFLTRSSTTITLLTDGQSARRLRSTTNWIASGGKWTAPRRRRLWQKLFQLGRQPLELDLDGYYNAILAQSRQRDLVAAGEANLSYFGMKAHFGVDSRTKLIHAAVATPANVADSTVLPDLLHGRETRVWGDQAYPGQRRVTREHAPQGPGFRQSPLSPPRCRG